MGGDNTQRRLWRQRRQLDQNLDVGIGKLSEAGKCLHEQGGAQWSMHQQKHDSKQHKQGHPTQQDGLHLDNIVCSECDMDLITLIWAYGAKVLHQALIASTISHEVCIDQTWVNLCLDRLEALPTRLVMRITWPYTIAGSMASIESQQQRFRWIVGKTLQGAQAPGISWKGLIVMEECWRLRRIHGDRLITWKDAMESLNAKVILT